MAEGREKADVFGDLNGKAQRKIEKLRMLGAANFRHLAQVTVEPYIGLSFSVQRY